MFYTSGLKVFSGVEFTKTVSTSKYFLGAALMSDNELKHEDHVF